MHEYLMIVCQFREILESSDVKDQKAMKEKG